MLCERARPKCLHRAVLPRPAHKPPMGRGRIYEIKHDCFRIMAQHTGGRVRLRTRKGTNFSNRFPQDRRRPDSAAGALMPDRRRGRRVQRSTSSNSMARTCGARRSRSASASHLAAFTNLNVSPHPTATAASSSRRRRNGEPVGAFDQRRTRGESTCRRGPSLPCPPPAASRRPGRSTSSKPASSSATPTGRRSPTFYFEDESRTRCVALTRRAMLVQQDQLSRAPADTRHILRASSPDSPTAVGDRTPPRP